MKLRGFFSDNNSGIHPDILKAIAKSNVGHTEGYGDDIYTDEAVMKLKEIFGDDIDAYFVMTGTAANVLGLTAVVKQYEAVICAETGHINEDECGAPENFGSFKLLEVETHDGKLRPSDLERFVPAIGNEHMSQPKVVSISQISEMGTVYTPDEIKALADFAHSNDWYLHMDGARIASAAVALDMGFREFTRDAGVDVLSFGGTKNGLMCGEAVIFFDKSISKAFKYIRKQGMQLASKMRFISAQFTEYLSNDLWYKNAKNANDMAAKLAEGLMDIPGVIIEQSVDANEIFVRIPPDTAAALREEYTFYIKNPQTGEARLVASFDTTIDDVDGFIDALRGLI